MFSSIDIDFDKFNNDISVITFTFTIVTLLSLKTAFTRLQIVSYWHFLITDFS